MSVPTIQFEAKLMGYAKSRNKDGDWTDIRLQVHPEETEELNRLKLGQRLQCVIVAIGDDEQPVTPQKPKGGELARRAGILCGDVKFQDWIMNRATAHGVGLVQTWPEKQRDETAADLLRFFCAVESRAELDHNPEAAEKFKALEFEFKQAHGLVAERTR